MKSYGEWEVESGDWQVYLGVGIKKPRSIERGFVIRCLGYHL